MSIESKLLDAFIATGTLTPKQVAAVTGPKYVGKYVLYLRLAGHEIMTHKTGRTVDHYTYTGVHTPSKLKPSERRLSNLGSAATKNVTTKPAPAPKVKSAKPAKPKPVTVAKVAAPKSPVKKKPVRDEVEETFGTTGVVSSRIDADWDAVDISDFKALGGREESM